VKYAERFRQSTFSSRTSIKKDKPKSMTVGLSRRNRVKSLRNFRGGDGLVCIKLIVANAKLIQDECCGGKKLKRAGGSLISNHGWAG
jgi:hypothetical protein